MQQLLCRISDTQPRLFVLKHSALRSNYQHVFSPGGRFVCNCLENGYYFAMCHMLLRAGRVRAECRYRCGRRWQQLAKPDARRGGGSDITGSLNNPLLPALVWNYQIEPDGSAKFLFEVFFFPNFQPMPFPWLSGIHRQLIDLARVPLLYSLFLLLCPHPYLLCCISLYDCSLLQSLCIVRMCAWKTEAESGYDVAECAVATELFQTLGEREVCWSFRSKGAGGLFSRDALLSVQMLSIRRITDEESCQITFLPVWFNGRVRSSVPGAERKDSRKGAAKYKIFDCFSLRMKHHYATMTVEWRSIAVFQ